MLISESGRIILVDDKQEEIEAVLTSLRNHGFPFLYFDGTQENLPQKPLEGIRFVFLDIELRGMEGQSEKTKASGVVAVLKKIISPNNGPYVIIFWTRHREAMKYVRENCATEKISPVACVDLEKPVGVEKITERLEHIQASR